MSRICGHLRQKIVSSKEFLQAKAATVEAIANRETLNIKEVDLFSACMKWAEAECKRTDKTANPENIRAVLGDILSKIRFPVMTSQDIAIQVAPTQILTNTQVLEIFNYLGSIQAGREQDVAKVSIFNAKPRKARRPPNWFKWDETKKKASLVLADDGMSVRSVAGEWATVGGDIVLDEGVHEWEITLAEYSTSNSYNVAIGVVPATFTDWNMTTLIGYSGKEGWGFITGTGQTCCQTNGGAVTAYTNNNPPCAVGSKILVHLDLDKHTLEYSINGRPMGAAFTAVNGPVRPAISMVQQQYVKLSFPE